MEIFKLIDKKITCVWQFVIKIVDKVTWRDTNRAAINLSTTIFHYMGMWPRKDEPRGIGPVVRACLSRVGLGFMVYTAFLGHPYLGYLTWGKDLQVSLESVSSTFVATLMTSAAYSLLYRRSQIERIFKALTEMNEWCAKLPQRPVEILERNQRWSEYTIFMIFGGFGVVFTSYSRLPSLYKYRELLYYAWYPFNEKESPNYEAVFVSTMLTHFYALLTVGIILALFMSLLTEAIGQFRLLSHNLKNILQTKQVQPRTQTYDELKQFAQGPARFHSAPTQSLLQRQQCRLTDRIIPKGPTEKEVVDVLKICVQHHYSILAFVEEVRLFYDLILFLSLLCTLVPTAMGVVLLIFAEVPLFKNQKTLMYMYLTFGSNCATAVCCWLADELTAESEGLRDAVFGCDWLSQSESFKRSMRIIMSHANQPVVIRVCGAFVLSMETFYAITKLTYSYCMAIWTYMLNKF